MNFLCSPILCEIWNNEITSKRSPENLKLAERIPVQEKEDPTLTKRYRPVSALATVSKMKKIIQSQIIEYVNKSLSCGYRKNYSTHYALISLVEKWK